MSMWVRGLHFRQLQVLSESSHSVDDGIGCIAVPLLLEATMRIAVIVVSGVSC